jgi:hypothetical protein
MVFKSEFEEGLTPTAYQAMLDQEIARVISNDPSFGACIDNNCPYC